MAAEINFAEEWHEIMIQLAASDPRLLNVASWMLEKHGEYDENEAKYERMARKACKYYGLDPLEDLDDVLELCEENLTTRHKEESS